MTIGLMRSTRNSHKCLAAAAVRLQRPLLLVLLHLLVPQVVSKHQLTEEIERLSIGLGVELRARFGLI